MKQLIIDTDPGVDDAIGIAFGIKAQLPISAIATVYGNSTVENCTTNALSILGLVEKNIPVYKGAGQPMEGKGRLAQSHGDNGLGGFTLETDQMAENISALEHYKNVLKSSDDITIVAIGPTTNLGLLAKENPELFNKAKRIVIMGGVFGQKGNVSPYAEFNVYNDPFALHQVLSTGHKEIMIVPADICRQVTFKQDVFNQITNEKLAQGMKKISDVYIQYYTNDSEYGQFEGGVMYDLLALALEVDSSLFTLTPAHVRVETADSEKFGLTEIVEGAINCQVVRSVDAEALKKLYIKVMNAD